MGRTRRELSWGTALGITVAGALGNGFGVAVVAAIIGVKFASEECAPDAEECMAGLAGLFYGLLAGITAAAITVLVLAIWLRVGLAFGIGAAASLLALAGAVWKYEQATLLLFLAALALVGGIIAAKPTRTTVLVGIGVVLLAAFPVGSKLISVWSEQRKIEAIVDTPLQSTLDGTSPSSVRYSSTGVEYAVLDAPLPTGERFARVNVTVRTLAADQEPCTGFTDKTEAPIVRCTQLGPNLWQASGRQTWYFVHADDRQWAFVSAGSYGNAEKQRGEDARAEEIARSLEPQSAWPLAADTADCGFCEWAS
ncbi:hypothetical protein AB0L70_26475 [Kribbella sp. NPDC051952]|uniref:hypothetical protein n=1 Tax=Kribbella sp. NPDC051952 TaxID=3154851 RepID=UPI0034325AF8